MPTFLDTPEWYEYLDNQSVKVSPVEGVKGNAETEYRTGEVEISPADILGSTAIGGGTNPIYYDGEEFAACDGTVGDENTPVYLSEGVLTAGAPNNLEDMSWAEISTISRAGKAASIFHVGQEKTVSIGGTDYKFVILGFDHDDLADGSGKAGITFGMKNCLSDDYDMHSSNTNENGWANCTMRTSTLDNSTQRTGIKYDLPSDLQDVIRTVTKTTGVGGGSTSTETTSDDLFLLSAVEVFGTYYRNQASSGYTQYTAASEGYQYDYYKGKTWCGYYTKHTVNSFGTTVNYSSNIYYQENGYKGAGDSDTGSVGWWLRSPYVGDTLSYCVVETTGDLSGWYAALSTLVGYGLGLSFAFCV